MSLASLRAINRICVSCPLVLHERRKGTLALLLQFIPIYQPWRIGDRHPLLLSVGEILQAMFAPPPAATLSRAEIQAKRAELQARRASGGTGRSSISSSTDLNLTKTSDSTTSSPQTPKPKKTGRFTSSSNGGVEEIREADKETWKFKKPKLGSKKSKSIKEGGSGISLPATLLPPPPPPPGPPSLRSDAGSLVESIIEESSAGRRDKAMPPKRPARPSGEMFLSPQLSAAMSDSFPRALTPESYAGSSFRSASASPATPPPFQAPPSVPGAYPVMASVNTGSPRPPPLPSPPMPSPPMHLSTPMLPGPASPPPSTPPPSIPEK